MESQPQPASPAASAKSLQSCPTLCDPRDGSPSGSPIPGILQARTLEWLPFPSPMDESEKWKWSRSVMSDSSLLHGLQLIRLLCPRDFPGKSIGVGCHCLVLNYPDVRERRKPEPVTSGLQVSQIMKKYPLMTNSPHRAASAGNTYYFYLPNLHYLPKC